MKLSLIVATANNNAIGRNNELPWHLPQDLKYFKSVTLGKPVIMGRKTFESIGKPLPGRTNIVVTRQKDWKFAGVLVAKSVEEALEIGQQFRNEQDSLAEEIMVIGGAEIYRHALPIADRVYLTRIDANVDGADAHFPELSANQWKLVSKIPGDVDANLSHLFMVYERVH
ncbi:dihydrofolate reductase [Cellvibrio zantedeschiae]|uniref:Dihydrofolate reductase n=1 Tax=Cellvibrio zantedeschiae TaxID=1237077 RepID=A0ABQ3B4D1_9GAMM|nr:dihydrofolate reductase [Cellvibrio zantedeschiae]GGY78422.1 dihydrofolate reductase [Cellvibrio zantedeschiae]